MCSTWLPVLFRFLAHSLTTFGRWGCGERVHLSHVVGDSVVVLSGMSRQIALQTLSEALRRTKLGLDAPQGMEGAKLRYRGSQELRRADTPNQGLSGSRRPRQPPAKPSCTELAATRLVGGRRLSVLQRWGSGGLPRRFPVALKALPEPWRLRLSGEREAELRSGGAWMRNPKMCFWSGGTPENPIGAPRHRPQYALKIFQRVSDFQKSSVPWSRSK